MKLVSLLIFSLVYSWSSHAQYSYHQDIAPILQKHCTSCHQKDNIGPMPLTTYEEVSSYAQMISFVVESGLMPPFKAWTPMQQYHNERHVTEHELSVIKKWIADGMHIGTSKPIIEETINTKVADFDTTLCMSENFEHYGIYYDQYQVFSLPNPLTTDRYISQINFLPGQTSIVRSATLSITTKKKAQKLDDWDPRYGYYAYGNTGVDAILPNWYNWMPDQKDEVTTKHRFMPTNTDLLLHIHYGPSGDIKSDSSCVQLSFADPPKPEFITTNTSFFSDGDSLLLRANTKQRVSQSIVLPTDIHVTSITPVAHLLCRSWNVFAVKPDKTSVLLLDIDDWDFHWKEQYRFANPILLPAGTRLVASAWYDNTDDNPFNPSTPPHTMRSGAHMFDEQFECYIETIPMLDSKAYFLSMLAHYETDLIPITIEVCTPGSYTLVLTDVQDSSSKTIVDEKLNAGNYTWIKSLDTIHGKLYALAIYSEDKLINAHYFRG